MNLQSLFSPKSIAIIGASTKPGSVGSDILKNIASGFKGKIYPINPKATELFGLTCYASLQDISSPIDLAIIVIPAASVPEILEQVGKKNIPAAVIISSGFKETGSEGKTLEDTVTEISKRHNITLLGPNCLGFIHPEIHLNASFASITPSTGNLALFSQSGALCTAILDSVQESRLGFSKFASIGNKAVIDENALLKYLAQDEQTSVISFYTEEIHNVDDIIQTGRAISGRANAKPIIALKAGLTQAGASASASHTGSLGGSASAYDALFKQSRIIQATTLREFFNLLFAFSQNKLPEGNSLAIITNAGGCGVLASDAAIYAGLKLAKLSSDTENYLKTVLPAAAGTHNPVDVLGDAKSDRYHAAIQAVIKDTHVDSILVILTPQSMTEIEQTADAIISAKKQTSKPIVAVFSGKTLVQSGIKRLESAGVTVLQMPEEGAQSIGALARVSQWRKETSPETPQHFDMQKEKVQEIFTQVKLENRQQLTEEEAWSVLEAYQFPFPKKIFAASEQATILAARAMRGKVVMKIVSPDIIHKSDAGGVMVNVDPEHVGAAYTQIIRNVQEKNPHAKIDGVLVVEMVEKKGKEIILGIKKEGSLGTLLMFGIGGIYVETMKDVSFRFTPLNSQDIQEMIHEIKALPLLQGVRGETGIDMQTLKEYIAKLSQLATDFPEIQELDINPLLAFSDASDFRVLDARIKIK